jgi:septum formation topological specificity factor MinE
MNRTIIETVSEAAKPDALLTGLFGDAMEYSRVYVLARQRQKGCDGMGELAAMKEEFMDIVDKMIQYSKEKKYIPQDISYDIDAVADEIVRRQNPL